MWIFATIELLPRPTLRGTAPYLAMLAVYLWCHAGLARAGDVALSALGLAVFAGLALTFARNMPKVVAAGEGTGWRTALAVPVALILGLAFVGVFVPDALAIQKGWLAGWLVYAFVFVGIVAFGEDVDIDRLPSRWATSDEPLARAVLMVHGLRHGLDLAVASWLMLHRPEIDWLVFVSLGRLATYYLAEWAIVLFILAQDDS